MEISLVTAPDIENEDTSPVIVGTADGVELLGRFDGVIDGDTVGEAVMKISQSNP